MAGSEAAGGPAGPPGNRAEGPVRAGLVPPLADGFIARSESAAGLAALVPGAAVALAPGPARAGTPTSTGHTQLAVFAAESLWRSQEVDLLVWVTASSRAAILAGLVQAASDAMRAVPAGDAEWVAGRFLGWLATTSRSWLVVFDGLREATDAEGLWPSGPSGRVLVTTTDPAAVPGGPRVQVFGVGGFSPREALSFLMGRLTADPDQRLGAIDLVDDLGCEPLALAQASAVIASSELTCRTYRDWFARRRDQIESAAGGKPAAAAVTWTLSVEHADRLVPGGGAQPMLAVAAVLDRHGIPATVLTAPATCRYLGAALGEQPLAADRARRVLLGLERVGLLSVDPGCSPPVVRMSGDVQMAVRRAMPPGMAAQAAHAAARSLLEAWPASETDQPWVPALLRSCVSALLPVAGEALWDGGVHPLLLRAGESLDRARLSTPAMATWRRLTEVSERVLGPGHPDTLLAGGKLAQACLAAGQPAEAASWFGWLLDRQVGALGPEHPGTLASRASLGHALLSAGRPAEAITMLSAAVAGCEQAHGGDHPDTLAARDELASAFRASGRLGEAAGLYRQILADRERVQGARHPGSLTTRQNLAGIYLADGRLKDAITEYKRVLAGREKILGGDHPDTIAARANLAAASHAAGRMAPAVRLYEQASEDCERVLGVDHPDTLARRVSLAHAYYEVGRLTDATTLLRDTAARCDRVLSPADPLVLTVRESLSNITGDQGPATAPR